MTDKCPHPALFNSMCVSCGKTIKDQAKREVSDDNSWGVTLTIAGGNQLKLSAEEAIKFQISKVSALRKAKKLALILDLDHTLLHAIQVDGAYDEDLSIPEDGLHHLPIEDVVEGTMKHLVMKKRPFLDDFLQEACKFCQMTVYTAGTRRYAEAVTKVLDPQRRYFQDRLVSRSDVPNVRADGNDKSLERIFLGDSSMAVIIDDREDVWKGEQGKQLLLVRPYFHFFGKVVEVNNSSGPRDYKSTNGQTKSNAPPLQAPTQTISLLSPGEIVKLSDTVPSDDQLPRILQVLRDIFSKYYGDDDTDSNSTTKCNSNVSVNAINTNADLNDDSKTNGRTTTASSSLTRSVATILTDKKKQVLRGCVLTFSGLIPSKDLQPETHAIWKLAESLGAQVSTELLACTTHLITAHLQPQSLTQKVTEALQRGDVWVLHPDWLIYSRWSVARAMERTFMLNQLRPGQSLPNPTMHDEPIPRKITANAITASNTKLNAAKDSSDTSSTKVDKNNEIAEFQSKDKIVKKITFTLRHDPMDLHPDTSSNNNSSGGVDQSGDDVADGYGDYGDRLSTIKTTKNVALPAAHKLQTSDSCVMNKKRSMLEATTATTTHDDNDIHASRKKTKFDSADNNNNDRDDDDDDDEQLYSGSANDLSGHVDMDESVDYSSDADKLDINTCMNGDASELELADGRVVRHGGRATNPFHTSNNDSDEDYIYTEADLRADAEEEEAEDEGIHDYGEYADDEDDYNDTIGVDGNVDKAADMHELEYQPSMRAPATTTKARKFSGRKQHSVSASARSKLSRHSDTARGPTKLLDDVDSDDRTANASDGSQDSDDYFGDFEAVLQSR